MLRLFNRRQLTLSRQMMGIVGGSSNPVAFATSQCRWQSSVASSSQPSGSPEAVLSTPPSPAPTTLERLKQETEEAKPRPDPAAMTSLLDVVGAIVELKMDYEPALAKASQRAARHQGLSQAPAGAGKMSANKRLIHRVDQRYLAHCVERVNELCEMAVSYPERGLLNEDLASFELLEGLLGALEEAVRFMGRQGDFPDRHASTGGKGGRIYSPWVSSATCELIGIWMHKQWTPQRIKAMPLEQVRRCLFLANDLFIGDVDAVGAMMSRLTMRESLLRSPNAAGDAVEHLNLVSLASKRFKLKPPEMGYLLSVISFAKNLTSQQSLLVLSSLSRVHEQRNLEIVATITRREASHASGYTLNDCVFALKACMSLSNVSELFVVEVIGALVGHCQKMSPREVAMVCHLVTMMRNSRRHAHVIRNASAREIRRLMPALLAQTKVHLKKFGAKDANYVLDCFFAFHVQHPYVLAQLAVGITE